MIVNQSILSCTGKLYGTRVLVEAWSLTTDRTDPSDGVGISVSKLSIAIAVLSYALEVGIGLIVFIITRPMGIHSENDSLCSHFLFTTSRTSVASLGTDILTISYCPPGDVRTTPLYLEWQLIPAVLMAVLLAEESFNTSVAAQMPASANGIDPRLCQSPSFCATMLAPRD